jgi:hypothetical protein
MASKNANRGSAKPRGRAAADPDQSVLGNLPSTRPARIGRRREATAATPSEPAAAKPTPVAAKAKSAPAKRKPKPKPVAPAKSAKPRAVRSGSPALKAAEDKKRPRKQAPPSPPKGTEIVTTAVQAAGELAQIGLTLGGQAVKRAVKRIPKR